MQIPKWNAGNSKLTTYIMKSTCNDEDYEIFLINKTIQNSDIIDACAAATTEIEDLLDKHNYFQKDTYTYHRSIHTRRPMDHAIRILIPTREDAEKMDNRFEIFTALLEMNKIQYKRPGQGFQVVEIWL